MYFCSYDKYFKSLAGFRHPSGSVGHLATVLVVDDNPQIRELVAAILRREGFSVLCAGSGDEALALSRSNACQFDVLLSDVAMPGMDGPTLAMALRVSAPDLPVILMSGTLEFSPPDSAANRFLRKPFSLTGLLQCVHELAKVEVSTKWESVAS